MTWRQTVSMHDAFSRITTRTFEITALDLAAANVIASSNLVAMQNFSEGGFSKSEVTTTSLVGSPAASGANVDTGCSIQFGIGPLKKATINMPMPVNSVFLPDGTLNLSDPIVLAFTDNFTSGAILISDGETADRVIKGYLNK